MRALEAFRVHPAETARGGQAVERLALLELELGQLAAVIGLQRLDGRPPTLSGAPEGLALAVGTRVAVCAVGLALVREGVRIALVTLPLPVLVLVRVSELQVNSGCCRLLLQV